MWRGRYTLEFKQEALGGCGVWAELSVSSAQPGSGRADLSQLGKGAIVPER